jgi:Spy/CpxP family protein refolding chaperone
MLKAAYSAALAALLVSSAVYAQTTPPVTSNAPAQATQQPAPADDPNEMICHAGEPIIGSRFPGPRTCHTRKEWDQIKRDSQEALFHQQMERSCNAGTNC